MKLSATSAGGATAGGGLTNLPGSAQLGNDALGQFNTVWFQPSGIVHKSSNNFDEEMMGASPDIHARRRAIRAKERRVADARDRLECLIGPGSRLQRVPSCEREQP